MAAIAEPGSFGGVLLRVLTGFAILAGQNNLMLAELLSKKFSAKQAGPKRTIQALYSVLVEQEASPEIQLAYDRWIALYSTSAYQTDETSRKQDRLWGEHFRLPGERELNDPARLVFSIHTFFAVVAKLLGCLAANCCGSAQILDLKNWTKIPNDRLGQNFQQLENGSFFEQAGLPHFLRGDVFGWYASNPTPELLSCLREIIGVLAECEDLLVTEAGGREDLLK